MPEECEVHQPRESDPKAELIQKDSPRRIEQFTFISVYRLWQMFHSAFSNAATTLNATLDGIWKGK